MKPAADKLQGAADGLSMAGGSLGVITGLTVYAAWAKNANADPRVEIVVASVAIVGGVLALLPRVKRYAERAQEVRTLASRYGEIFGELLDVHHLPGSSGDEVAVFQRCARTALDKYQVIKADKDKIPKICAARPTDDERRIDDLARRAPRS